MYITRDGEQLAAGQPEVTPTGGGGVNIEVDGVSIHLYHADMRRIIAAYPNNLMVNYVRHNRQFKVVGSTIIPCP